MRFHRTGNIVFHSTETQDLDYVKQVAEKVYALYHGDGPDWHLPESDEMWEISFGGRAGVLGVKLRDRISCVKLFYDERIRTKLRIAAGFSKGRRAYQHGVRLAEAGIGCPRMLGWAEQRPTGPTMIVTELADNTERLDAWAAEHNPPPEAIAALARFIRRLHDKGIWHADLSPRNILIRTACSPCEFLLLDYEDAHFATRVSRRRRLENLHHLHERMVGYVPLRDRLRFLRVYAPSDYHRFRDTLRRMIEESGFEWLRSHEGPNTLSGPLHETK